MQVSTELLIVHCIYLPEHTTGCQSFAHASFIDDAGIDACLLMNTWIVPTFLVGEYYAEQQSYDNLNYKLRLMTDTMHLFNEQWLQV